MDGKGGSFHWQQLHSTPEEGGAQSPSLVARQRGHGRSSSLDLKKMLQGNDSSSGEHDTDVMSKCVANGCVPITFEGVKCKIPLLVGRGEGGEGGGGGGGGGELLPPNRLQ